MDTTVTTAAVQDYLKAIYLLESPESDSTSMSALAAHLRVRPASASGMVGRLAAEGLVEHVRYGGVRLTPAGRRLALAVVRRHRLLETLLVEDGMGWDEVHVEAEALEHSVSDRLLARIAAKLGEPVRDPHGDPIPSAALEVDEAAAQILERLPVGATGRVVRVLGAEPELLAYLERQGVEPVPSSRCWRPSPSAAPCVCRYAAASAASAAWPPARWRSRSTSRCRPSPALADCR